VKPETIVALVSACLAAVVAVVVPLVSFLLAMRQDHTRWLREQRAKLYVDMLTEAYAEQQWLQHETAREETRQLAHYEDLRLPPLERAQLGARSSMYGSEQTNMLFNRLQAEGFWTLPFRQVDEGQRSMLRVRLGRVFSELSAAIREEMRTDKLLGRGGRSKILDEPHPAERAEREFWERARRSDQS
jgi:hypothetical protein